MSSSAGPAPGPLSLEAIVEAAVALIEEEGVGRLTMRRLALRLGCSPMALYRHVATKQDLLRAISEHRLAGVAFPDTSSLDWRETIVAVCATVHRAILAEAPLLELLPVQHVDAFAVLRASEVVLRELRSVGLTDAEAVAGLSVITSYSVGATERKAAQRAGAPAEAERLRRILALPEEQFPAMRSLAGQVVAVDHDLSFEDGLRRVLAGIVPIPASGPLRGQPV